MRLLFLVFLVACSGETITGLEGSMPFDSPQFLPLWQKMEACSGLQGDFTKVHFYAAPGAITRNGELAGGLWVRDGNRIYLTPPYADDWFTIEHEEMHALLQTGKHPVHYFNGVCGKLMTPTG